MNRSNALAILALVLGVLVLIYTATGDNGLELSFPLLLGLLLVADGVVRLLLARLPRSSDK